VRIQEIFAKVIRVIIVRRTERKSVEEKAAVQHDLSCIRTRVSESRMEKRDR